ncbi:putative nucleic acid-binding protein, contains PIN domain [Singulisphaera acidiphila DSM 18658]|uniref:Putative nucleic acid-binding protein, contains PIN domain n=2 Tax=Singulisphaera acidiphila TaxID=466153 RepID=L0DHI7_SINAD|nr:putative nucleic acid-binding protein, contains PIN domain [Singulisphaera acidiphila DSM 18658]
MSKKKGVAKAPKEGMILDCSIVMAWFFADESSEYADDVARQLPDQMAYVPSNWPLEVANTLIMGERRKRSTQTQAARLIKNLAALPITVDEESNLHAWNSTLSLAREQNLTAYDAAYLELAMRRGLPLATLDDKLKAAATAVGVPLFGLQ